MGTLGCNDMGNKEAHAYNAELILNEHTTSICHPQHEAHKEEIVTKQTCGLPLNKPTQNTGTKQVVSWAPLF